MYRPSFKNLNLRSGMLTDACNSNAWEAEVEDSKFKARLNYVLRPCANNNKDGL
jgi:hypothetical protein